MKRKKLNSKIPRKKRRRQQELDDDDSDAAGTSKDLSNSTELANDFALLPHEVINDVIKSHALYEAHWGEIGRLSGLSGAWADYADLSMSGWRLRNTRISKKDKFDDLEADAPRLYDVIVFGGVSDKICENLDLFGTRFTDVAWVNSLDRTKPIALHISNFLKRQLSSKYLRKMQICGVEGDLNAELAEFVKRPVFEYLFRESVSFEVVRALHSAWAATQQFQVNTKKLLSVISAEELKQLEEYLEIRMPSTRRKKTFRFAHPTHETAKAKLFLKKTEGSYLVQFDFLCSWDGVSRRR